MELNREFMLETAGLIRQILPFTTFAAFLDVPTSGLLYDTENPVVYDELLGVPRSREPLLYDILPVAQSPRELAFKLSEKKVLNYFKQQSVEQLERSVGKVLFEVIAGEFAAAGPGEWQHLFSSTKDDFDLLSLMMNSAQTYFSYLGLAPMVNKLREMSVADVQRLLGSFSSQTAVEITFEVPLQQVYDCIDVFRIQLQKHPAEILQHSSRGKILVFQNGECNCVSFLDFKFMASLNLSKHELDIMRALYSFDVRSADGEAIFSCHKQRQVYPIIQEHVYFIKSNRLFALTDVVDLELRANMRFAADFCDIVILTLFGRNMPEIQRLEQLQTFAYPSELGDLVLRISRLCLEQFFAEKAIFQSFADELLQFYERLNKHRKGDCIEAMFVGSFARVSIPGAPIRGAETGGAEASSAEQRGEIVAEFQQKLASRWAGGSSGAGRSLESSIRDLQEQMADCDERPTVEELFGLIADRE